VSESETKSEPNGTNETSALGGSLGTPWFDFAKLDFSRNPFAEMAARGVTDYGLKLLEVSSANAASAIDFLSHVLECRSVSDVVAISATEARRAVESAAARNRELFGLAQRLASHTGEPIRNHLVNAVRQAS